MRTSLFFSLIILAFGKKPEKVSYDGYKGLEITTPDKASLKVVEGLTALGAVFMHDPSLKRPCEVAIPPKVYDEVIKKLKDNGITKFTVLYKDLQKIVNQQVSESRKNSKISHYRTNDDGASIATYFPTYHEAEDWMRTMARKHKQLAKIVKIGKSHNGLHQQVMVVGSPGVDKPVIWVDAGIHAREWTTVPTALYIIYKLLSGYKSGDTKALLDKYDFHILPVFNPDGYIHSHTVDRFWRKNRRTGDHWKCSGVDLNRNFGHQWGVAGVSRDPCDQSYLGSAPFSEPETRNVRDALLALKPKNLLTMYLNLHAYGELWFLPYGYDSKAEFDGMEEHYRVAEAATRAIYKASGRNRRIYTVGKPGDLIYDAAGGTFDWAYAVAGAKYAFAAELSPSFYEGGRRGSGFEISPNRIPGIAEEVYQGVKAAVEAI